MGKRNRRQDLVKQLRLLDPRPNHLTNAIAFRNLRRCEPTLLERAGRDTPQQLVEGVLLRWREGRKKLAGCRYGCLLGGP